MSKKVREEPKQGAPAFIVTFSDMITLLLTFFVMLLSLAKDRVDEHKFKIGQSSFKKAVADFGMTGSMFSKGTGPDLGNPKVKYKVSEDKAGKSDKLDTRSTDHHMEVLKRVVMEIEQMMEVSPSQISGTSKSFNVTNITFPPGNWQLDDNDKNEIKNFSIQFQESLSDEATLVYVVGLANTEANEKENWKLSAKRAESVSSYFKGTLPGDLKWDVFSWGAGTGGAWTSENGLLTRETQILIALIVQE